MSVKDRTVQATAAAEERDDPDVQCGIGPCRSGWMQIFASKQVFLATFCFSWVLQGMFSTYFVSVITTLEKLFQLQSKTMGIVLSATEIGQIGSSLLLTYYGGQGHRPRWIASSMVLFAVAAFACSSPHFLFGHLHQYPPQAGSGHAATAAVTSATTATNGGGGGGGSNNPSNVCVVDGGGNDYNNNKTSANKCENVDLAELQQQSKNTQIVLAIFFTSMLGVGIAQTAVYTLGIPFIDDNVASRESPLYFSITIGVRILGPAFGFLLGAYCTSLYAGLGDGPGTMDTSDPHWVGAWWLGLVGISATLLLTSVPMFAFPKRLQSAAPQPSARSPRSSSSSSVVAAGDAEEKKKLPLSNGTAAAAAATSAEPGKTVAPRIKDFPAAVKRLLKNDMLMYRTASSVLHLLPLAGIYTFLPKYFESQFHFPTHTANMVTGIYGIMVMGIGIIVSGIFILKKNPNARAVAAWIAFTALAYSVGMCILMFFGCPTTNISGLKYDTQNLQLKFESECSDRCVCDHEVFSPVCVDGTTYFSACHAGCRNLTFGKEYSGGYKFTDCQCVYGNVTEASPSYCKEDCENAGSWYIVLFSLFVFIHSTSEVGSMLLILRCVRPQDKAMALGLIQFAIGLFGNVPCPILYGAVVDSACLIWETTCGKQGACKLYDSDSFRIFYHGITGLLMMGAFFVDIVVWYKAGSINFEDDHQLPINEEEMSQLTPITDKSETTV